MFSEKEIAYLDSQRLARIAPASEDSQPDVAPVGHPAKGLADFNAREDPRTIDHIKIISWR